jgi:hypothetical protein
MATRLSSLLVQDGLVSVKRMEEAFQRQVIYGGSLDTILLEMRALDEPQLLQYLELATGMAPVDLDEVFSIDRAALDAFPQMLAESEGVAPLRLTDTSLRVLVVDPPDRGRLDQLGFSLGLQLDPRIAPQCRLFQAWHVRYGLPIPARHASLAARLKLPSSEQPRPGPRRPVVVSQPAPEKAGAATIPDITAAAAAATAAARRAVVQAEGLLPRPPATEGPGPLTIEEAGARIEKTQDRDEIFGSLARAAVGRLDFAAVFTVHGTTATGRLAYTLKESHDLTQVSLPLTGESVLAATLRSAAPYLGPAGDDADNAALFAAIGRARPTTVVLVPVVIRGRVVAILYGERGERTIEAARVTDLFTLGHDVGRAFLRLIMRAKKDVYSQAAGTEGQLGAVAEKPKPVMPAGEWARAEAVHAARASFAPPREPEPAVPAEELPEITIRETIPLAVLHEAEEPPPVEEAPPAAAPLAAAAETPPAAWEEGELEEVTSPDGLAPGARRRRAARKEQERAARVGTAPAAGRPTPARAEPEAAAAEERTVEVIADLPSGRYPLAPLPWDDGPPGAPAPTAPTPTAPAGAVTLVSPGAVEALLRDIENSPDSTQAHRAAAALERMGDQAIQVLVKQFPGKLRVDHFSAPGKLPPVGEHSAVLRLLVNFGRPAVRHVLPLLGSPNDDIRFYATYIFSELVFAEVVPHVAQRLQDPEYAIRAVAVEVLRRYLATPEMREVLEALRGDLPGPEEVRQRYAAEALGELRDVVAVPRLIELVDHEDSTIAKAAQQALLVVTKQDFGHRERQWRGWWQKNRHRHRIEWMLDGLGHATPEIRLSASEELRRLTHEHFGYHFDLPKREREEARLKWVAWWEHVGRRSHTGSD